MIVVTAVTSGPASSPVQTPARRWAGLPERLQRPKDCKTSGEQPLVLRKNPEEMREVLVGSCKTFEEQQLVLRKSFVELLEEHHS